MKAYIFIYEGFANFEISIATLLLRSKFEVVTFSLDTKEVNSCEGFKFVPHTSIYEIGFEQEDILVIPGGNPESLYNIASVYQMINSANQAGVVIAAICAGPIHLAKAGVLKDKRYTVSTEDVDNIYLEKSKYQNDNVVIDENIVTAKGSGYAEFAVAVANKMGIFSSEEELKGTVDFFINYIN